MLGGNEGSLDVERNNDDGRQDQQRARESAAQREPTRPPPGQEDVELYIRTYNTLLRSSGEIPIKALEEVHANSGSSLHPGAHQRTPDMSALIYALLRLPAEIMGTRRVVLGQAHEIFVRHGFGSIDRWRQTSAPGRRRLWRFDGRETLAAYITSPTDVDDLIPTLTAFQIEWNKLHALIVDDTALAQLITEGALSGTPGYAGGQQAIREHLLIGEEDWQRLRAIWSQALLDNLGLIGVAKKRLTVLQLEGSHVGYVRATRNWWEHIVEETRDLGLGSRPVYFVSSNRHSLVNPLSGFALRRRDELVYQVERGSDPEMREAYAALQAHPDAGGWENFLYFAGRQYHGHDGNPALWQARTQEEQERGIHYAAGSGAMDVGAQVIELCRLRPADLDPRLTMPGLDRLAASKALILNIDYPLGLQAYHILRRVAEHVAAFSGIYILGKAATLNGRIGDVMIASMIFDEHSGNSYWFDNPFSARDVDPYLVYGSVLDNQKAVAVKGTFLQNRGYLDFYYRESFTVLEMEAGPYFNALYEYTFPSRYPQQEHVNMRALGCEVGLLHYASDTPYTRGRNLGARSLSYYGMDSTYAASIVILRRILSQEIDALG